MSLLEIIQTVEFWQYLSIPFIAGFIGWITNWLAIKLTFLPLEFVGIRPFFGWQGIIPSKAKKMAIISVDATISKIGTIEDVFEEMEPSVLADYLVKVIQPRVEEYVDEVMLRDHATLWENLPHMLKKRVYERVTKRLPGIIDNLVEDLRHNVSDMIDLKHMVIDKLAQDKALLNRIFLECGDEEFRFIINSGLYFGFAFGLIQTLVWYFYQVPAILPIAGLIVGFATNWVALNVIFRPLNPIKIGPLHIQGLFLKRQKEVARVFCRIVTQEVITLRNLVDTMITGPRSDRTLAAIRKHIKPLVDESAGYVRPLTQLAFGAKGFADLKKQVAEKAIDISTDSFNDSLFNKERGERVEAIMRERMEALSSAEFQDLLRPCFQEDEIKLILIGAALGFLAGVAQLLFVFDLPWPF